MLNKEKYLAEAANFQRMTNYVRNVYSNTRISIPKRAEELKQVAFSEMLLDLKEAKRILINGPYVQSKVKNVSGGLPLVSSLMNEVGNYGLIFAGGLQNCQYYKKISPPPPPTF